MSDKPETVILVLNTLKLKIVENVKISKTVKIRTFNTPVLRSLAKLYDYERDHSKVSTYYKVDSRGAFRNSSPKCNRLENC